MRDADGMGLDDVQAAPRPAGVVDAPQVVLLVHLKDRVDCLKHRIPSVVSPPRERLRRLPATVVELLIEVCAPDGSVDQNPLLSGNDWAVAAKAPDQQVGIALPRVRERTHAQVAERVPPPPVLPLPRSR
jgi:hypothetical protein